MKVNPAPVGTGRLWRTPGLHPSSGPPTYSRAPPTRSPPNPLGNLSRITCERPQKARPSFAFTRRLIQCWGVSSGHGLKDAAPSAAIGGPLLRHAFSFMSRPIAADGERSPRERRESKSLSCAPTCGPLSLAIGRELHAP